MKPIVLIPEPISASGINLLKTDCECIMPWAEGKPAPPSESVKALAGADAILVRLFQVQAPALAQAPRLKVVAKHGVGVDNIDVPALTARRIPVVFTPTANANAVAEHTLTLMLSLARHLFPAGVAFRDNRFNERTKFEGVELAGKTLAVLGLGRIGNRVAEMARWGFKMEVHGYDPFVSKDTYQGPAILEESLETLLAKADFVTLHLPLTPATNHLLNEDRLRLMKRDCRIINTSRGGVIDETALANALRQGAIAGAALDVFEQEPPPPDHPFLQTPNTLLTPHISSSTRESLDRMSADAAQGILDVLQGRIPLHLVNPQVFS